MAEKGQARTKIGAEGEGARKKIRIFKNIFQPPHVLYDSLITGQKTAKMHWGDSAKKPALHWGSLTYGVHPAFGEASQKKSPTVRGYPKTLCPSTNI